MSIYALVDPRTNEIRYIGQSIQPRERLLAHCRDKSKTWRTNWIREVLANGYQPELRILEELAEGVDWKEAERRWIAYGHAQGWKLTNGTSGGDGVPDLPLETRERIRRANIGKRNPHTPEWSAIMSAKLRGVKKSPEHAKKSGLMHRKLSNSDVIEIRRLLAAGISQNYLADKFGVNQMTISHVSRGIFYGEVREENPMQLDLFSEVRS